MKEQLLDEYVKITKTIDNIQLKLTNYKKKIEESIENSKSEEEQQNKIIEFKEIINKIKNDETISKKYKLLKKNQEEIRKKLIINDSIDTNEIDDKITILFKKYSKS